MQKQTDSNATVIFYNIGVDAPTTPSDSLPPTSKIPQGSIIVVSGRAPIWRYALALSVLYDSGADAIATFDPKLGAIVVRTNVPQYRKGQILDVYPDDCSRNDSI